LARSSKYRLHLKGKQVTDNPGLSSFTLQKNCRKALLVRITAMREETRSSGKGSGSDARATDGQWKTKHSEEDSQWEDLFRSEGGGETPGGAVGHSSTRMRDAQGRGDSKFEGRGGKERKSENSLALMEQKRICFALLGEEGVLNSTLWGEEGGQTCPCIRRGPW